MVIILINNHYYFVHIYVYINSFFFGKNITKNIFGKCNLFVKRCYTKNYRYDSYTYINY